MKPLIALTPSLEKSSGNTYMNPGYLRGVTMAGGLPLILPLSCEGEDLDRLLSLCGGVLFTGGPDVDPAVYGEARLNESVELCPERDALEFSLLEKAMRAGLPVLGICRGCQLINTALGGTLYQDLPTQRPGPIQHRQPEPITCPQHENRILPGTPLAAALSQASIAVNSCHHQAIRTLADGLLPSAVAGDGLIEGFCHESYPYLWGVQWHPERLLGDPASLLLFRSFVRAAEERAPRA